MVMTLSISLPFETPTMTLYVSAWIDDQLLGALRIIGSPSCVR
jgi:hypothetical protein